MRTSARGGSGRRVFATAVSAIAFLALTTAGCSVTGKVRSAFGGNLPLKVTVAPGANDDSAIAVDFVVVYDQKVLDEVMKVTASEWFASKKARFLADHPTELMVEAREWVPGQPVSPITIPYRAGARKIVVFADYHSGGEHRAVVPPQQPSHVVLGETDIKVEAQP